MLDLPNTESGERLAILEIPNNGSLVRSCIGERDLNEEFSYLIGKVLDIPSAHLFADIFNFLNKKVV